MFCLLGTPSTEQAHLDLAVAINTCTKKAGCIFCRSYRSAQRGGGCPIPADSRGQAGRGSEQLMELWVSLFSAGGWTGWPLRVPSNSNGSTKQAFTNTHRSRLHPLKKLLALSTAVLQTEVLAAWFSSGQRGAPEGIPKHAALCQGAVLQATKIS